MALLPSLPAYWLSDFFGAQRISLREDRSRARNYKCYQHLIFERSTFDEDQSKWFHQIPLNYRTGAGEFKNAESENPIELSRNANNGDIWGVEESKERYEEGMREEAKGQTRSL